MRRVATAVLVAGVVLGAVLVTIGFVRSEHWIWAIVQGVVVPVGALYERYRVQGLGLDAVKASERMLLFVLLTMVGIGAAAGW